MKHRNRRFPQVIELTGVTINAVTGTGATPQLKRLSTRARKKLAKHAPQQPLSKADPSRTLSMRKAFEAVLTKQFDALKRRIVEQIGKQDVLGLVTLNELCRDVAGRFSSCGVSREGGPDVGEKEANVDSTHHLGVVYVVREAKERWGYHGETEVLNQAGPMFERGGVQWREGANCRLSDGKVTVHSQTAGNEVKDIEHLTAHEFMHGTFEKVHQQYEAEKKETRQHDLMEIDRLTATGVPPRQAYKNDALKLRNDGTLRDSAVKEYPTLHRFQKLLDDPKVYEQLKTDDGITEYSKAYWRDFEQNKCTFHTALHETLAEMAGIHEATGGLLGSKLYRELYKAVRDEYKVLQGDQKKRKKTMGGAVENAALFYDHEMYLDADFNPATIGEAKWIRWWRADGSNGWGVRADAFSQEVVNDLRMDIRLAAQRTDADPTDAQKEAGNYRKGRVSIQGLEIRIETPKGVKRQPWHDKPVAAHYGYILRVKK